MAFGRAAFRRQRLERRALSTRYDLWLFTAVLLAFGLIFWIAGAFTIITSRTGCHFAEIWLTGWFGGASPLQLWSAGALCLFLLFATRLVVLRLWRTAPLISAAQGIFIAGLILTLGALHAHILPNAFPPDRAYQYLASASGMGFVPLEYRETEPRTWPYEFRPPPPSPWSHDPTWNAFQELDGGRYLSRNLALFPSRQSPLWSELQAARTCRVAFDAAMEAHAAWRREFDAWAADNLVDRAAAERLADRSLYPAPTGPE